MNNETVLIEVPKRELVSAFLEKVARASEPPYAALTEMQSRAALLPAIGAPLEGGLYAGITVHLNLPMALVLLPEKAKCPWEKAKAWAQQQGGTLPSRFDALVLWQNLPAEFEKDWYWTSEEVAGNADYAWFQYFSFGGQYYDRKSGGYRCRAVRRVSVRVLTKTNPAQAGKE